MFKYEFRLFLRYSGYLFLVTGFVILAMLFLEFSTDYVVAFLLLEFLGGVFLKLSKLA